MDKERFPNKKSVEDQKADLSGADLSDADLSNANLTDANLTDANLSNANLRGAVASASNRAGQYSRCLCSNEMLSMMLTSRK